MRFVKPNKNAANLNTGQEEITVIHMNLNKLAVLLMFMCIAYAANLTVNAPVKQVTLYSNGFAFSIRSGSVSLPSGSHTLHILNFTDSAVFPSITPRFSNAKLAGFYKYAMHWNESKNITEYYSFERLLNNSISKNISFDFNNETVRGKLVWFSKDLLGISENGNVSVYRLSDIRHMTLPVANFSEIKQENESKEEHGLAIDVKNGNGNSILSVSYLVAGAGWDVSYKYYIETESANGTGNLQGWANVKNNAGEDWNGISLRLVVGNPHMRPRYTPFHYPYLQYAAKESGYAAGAALSPEFTASPVSAYYVYSLADTISIKDGEEKNLPLLEKQITYKREYFWNTSKQHPEKIFILNNTGDESWASGVVSIYVKDNFIGEDFIDYTPKNAETRVSVSDLPDIVTKKEVLNQTSTATAKSRTTYYKMRISLRNAMGEDISLRINDEMNPGDEVKLISSTIPAQIKPQNILEWNMEMKKDSLAEIVYEYTVTNYYIEPRY